ncbi:hypothetical protein XENTR_v10020648 [Xenopus tropicalis]|nr:hypothetical protein XENTR_v10020648 [Xenopus tropicalis]
MPSKLRRSCYSLQHQCFSPFSPARISNDAEREELFCRWILSYIEVIYIYFLKKQITFIGILEVSYA